MKKWIFIFVLCFNTWAFSAPESAPADLNKCKKDADCVAALSYYCCDVAHKSKIIGINKKYLAAYKTKGDWNGSTLFCPPGPPNAGAPICIMMIPDQEADLATAKVRCDKRYGPKSGFCFAVKKYTP